MSTTEVPASTTKEKQGQMDKEVEVVPTVIKEVAPVTATVNKDGPKKAAGSNFRPSHPMKNHHPALAD